MIIEALAGYALIKLTEEADKSLKNDRASFRPVSLFTAGYRPDVFITGEANPVFRNGEPVIVRYRVHAQPIGGTESAFVSDSLVPYIEHAIALWAAFHDKASATSGIAEIERRLSKLCSLRIAYTVSAHIDLIPLKGPQDPKLAEHRQFLDLIDQAKQRWGENLPVEARDYIRRQSRRSVDKTKLTIETSTDETLY
jgi:hypothetical protein